MPMTVHTLEQQSPDAPTLLCEANHRIANHLSLLAGTVQMEQQGLSRGPAVIPRDDVKRMMQAITSKIVTVGHLHRRLADQPHDRDVDLGDFLIESAANLVSALSLNDRVRITHRLSGNCHIPAQRVQPIALLISEIVMNAVKYAHPTGIPVQLLFCCNRMPDGGLLLEIGDDGVGLPENFDPLRDGGTGFTLIRALSEKLGATLRVQSDSLGTSFHLTIPPEDSRVVSIGADGR
jgi:two-component sensor histidine kinase